MSFETELRDKIAKAPHRSVEKDVLRVVLGEISVNQKLSDNAAFSVVKKMIAGNDEMLSHMRGDDSRCKTLLDENKILKTLLPQYMSEEQILAELVSVEDRIKSAKAEPQAMGVAMEVLKAGNRLTEGTTVKKAVAAIRSRVS